MSQSNEAVHPTPLSEPKVRSEVCKSVINNFSCKFAGKCFKAHNVEEFTPEECKFANSCRYTTTCKNIHSGESKEQVWERASKVQKRKEMKEVTSTLSATTLSATQAVPTLPVCPNPKGRPAHHNTNEALQQEYSKGFSAGFSAGFAAALEQIRTNAKAYPATTATYTPATQSPNIATPRSYQKPVKQDLKTKTKPCATVLQGEVCKYGDNCRFAHSMKEINLTNCKKDASCPDKDTDCDSIHSGETRDEYSNRRGLPYE
jgi:hypothetical protein